jgi:ribulose-5-phosphate 4-epimerase/fuculose-1-phosphate aldolase
MKIGDIEYPSLKGKVSQAEWNARVELAAIFRLHHMSGLSDLLQAGASARIPGEEQHYLFSPGGCVWDEITASCLVKITLDGKIVSDTPFKIIRDFWYPMQAVHTARKDANFLIHTHNSYAVAMSARKDPLVYLSQASAVVLSGKVAYYDYEGVETHEAAMPALARAVGDATAVVLRNHGALVIGTSAFDAYLMMDQLVEACRVQLLAGQSRDLVQIKPEVVATFPSELERAANYPTQWLGLLRRLDRIEPSYRD